MRNKLVFICLILILLSGCSSSNKSIKKLESDNIVKNEIVEEQPKSEVEIIEEEKNEEQVIQDEKKDSTVKSKTVEKKETSVVENTTPKKEVPKETTVVPKEEKKVESEIIEIDIPEQPSSKEDDPEYQRLYNLSEFHTYKECYNASIDVSAESEDIRNTSCEDVIYKGEVIGYRIIIFYYDGSWKYHKTA